jgi:hypothetical protein
VALIVTVPASSDCEAETWERESVNLRLSASKDGFPGTCSPPKPKVHRFGEQNRHYPAEDTRCKKGRREKDRNTSHGLA